MTECVHEHFDTQVEMATNQPKEGSPETLFRQRPDKSFLRDFFSDKLTFPDGAEHEIWSFEDEESGRSFPAPLMRVQEGDVVHMEVKPSKGPHTIHLHGVEPDPRNDGVGHTSFEVSGHYTYQFRPQPGVPRDPNRGTAGTYFYHCHVNTPLHVQMGMFGPIVVDPVEHPDFPTSPGARRVFVDGPEYDVATETLLVPFAVDPRWHELGHAAGLSGEDVGLNRFEPDAFYLLGGQLADTPPKDSVLGLRQIRARPASAGLPTLLRLTNATYFPTQVRFTDGRNRPVQLGEVVSHDGRAYRDTSRRGRGRLPRERRNKLMASRIAFGAAERYDVLVQPPIRGEYFLHVDLFHWITRKRIATRTVPVLTD